MDNNRVSELITQLATETATMFEKKDRKFKFVHSFYLSNDEPPQVIGESLNIISFLGLKKFATVNLAYSSGRSDLNEVIIYPSDFSCLVYHSIKSNLNRNSVTYRMRSENV